MLSLWKYLAKTEIRRIRGELIRLGDPSVLTRRVQAPSETAPPATWEIEQSVADVAKGLVSFPLRC